MKLSEHFDSKEFRCPCCGKEPLPPPALIDALESIRAALGGHPVTINSGYRCPRRNTQVGGEAGSLHMRGLAADIRIAGRTGMEIYEKAKLLPALHGLGVERGYCHIDVRSGPRSQWLYDGIGRVIAWQEKPAPTPV